MNNYAEFIFLSERSTSPLVTATEINDGIRLQRQRLLSACSQIHFVHKINFGYQNNFSQLFGKRNNSAMKLGQ